MTAFDPARLGFRTACFAGMTLDEAARRGRAMGFKTIELLAFDGYSHSQGVLRGFYFEHMSASEREALRDLVRPFDHVSTHAPFIDMAPLAPNPSVRETAQRQLEIAVEAVAYLAGATTTTHAAPRQGCSFAQWKGEAVELYRRLGDLAGEAGVTVTIETGCPGPIEQFADLVWSVDHPCVGANVDVGHLRALVPAAQTGTAEGAVLYNDLLEAHLRSLGAKLFHCHLHDVRLADFRDHRAAGRGFVDYERLLRVAGELDYRGVLVFELEEPDMEAALAESKGRIEAAVAAVDDA